MCIVKRRKPRVIAERKNLIATEKYDNRERTIKENENKRKKKLNKDVDVQQ